MRVLVVASSPGTRAALAAELAGFEVVEADTLADGLAELERDRGELAAVVADLLLGTDAAGFELLEVAQAKRPRVRRVLVAGAVVRSLEPVILAHSEAEHVTWRPLEPGELGGWLRGPAEHPTGNACQAL